MTLATSSSATPCPHHPIISAKKLAELKKPSSSNLVLQRSSSQTITHFLSLSRGLKPADILPNSHVSRSDTQHCLQVPLYSSRTITSPMSRRIIYYIFRYSKVKWLSFSSHHLMLRYAAECHARRHAPLSSCSQANSDHTRYCAPSRDFFITNLDYSHATSCEQPCLHPRTM
jgi:hypothetical protein